MDVSEVETSQEVAFVDVRRGLHFGQVTSGACIGKVSRHRKRNMKAPVKRLVEK
jgi:hypothetical protein